jgi:hypothetical protein
LYLHPQRYAVAALDAAAMLFAGGSERQASLALWGVAVGEPIELDAKRPEMTRFSVPMSEKELRQAADRIRKLAQWYVSPADLLWRAAIAQALVLAVTLGQPDILEQVVIQRAGAVDEAAWARETLLPLIRRRRQQLPGRRDQDDLVGIFVDYFSSQPLLFEPAD